MTERPSIDHGILSPSGRVSKRSRKLALERATLGLFGPGGLRRGECLQPDEAEVLKRRAKELRELAARGMKPKAYLKLAEKLEALLQSSLPTTHGE